MGGPSVPEVPLPDPQPAPIVAEAYIELLALHMYTNFELQMVVTDDELTEEHLGAQLDMLEAERGANFARVVQVQLSIYHVALATPEWAALWNPTPLIALLYGFTGATTPDAASDARFTLQRGADIGKPDHPLVLRKRYDLNDGTTAHMLLAVGGSAVAL